MGFLSQDQHDRYALVDGGVERFFRTADQSPPLAVPHDDQQIRLIQHDAPSDTIRTRLVGPRAVELKDRLRPVQQAPKPLDRPWLGIVLLKILFELLLSKRQ